MDPHRLGEERSIAYHTLIAERVLHKPEVLEAARRRVAEWMTQEPVPFYAQKWSEILARAPEAIGAFLVERSELAIELRQSTPFAGAITPQERWKIFHETRERIAEAESEEPVSLSPIEEQEISEAAEAIRRGDYEDGDALLAELRSARTLVPHDQHWFHHPEMQARIARAEANFASGRATQTKTPEEALAFLDSLKRPTGPCSPVPAKRE
jgi:hypothetical protein